MARPRLAAARRRRLLRRRRAGRRPAGAGVAGRPRRRLGRVVRRPRLGVRGAGHARRPAAAPGRAAARAGVAAGPGGGRRRAGGAGDGVLPGVRVRRPGPIRRSPSRCGRCPTRSVCCRRPGRRPWRVSTCWSCSSRCCWCRSRSGTAGGWPVRSQRPGWRRCSSPRVVFVAVVVLGHLGWPAAADLLDVAASVLLITVLVGTALGRDGVEVVVHRTAVWVTLTLLIAGGYVAVTAAAAAAGARAPTVGGRGGGRRAGPGPAAGARVRCSGCIGAAALRRPGRPAERGLDRSPPPRTEQGRARRSRRRSPRPWPAHCGCPWVEVSTAGHTARHGQPVAAPAAHGRWRSSALTSSSARWPWASTPAGAGPPEDDRLLEVIARQAAIALRAAVAGRVGDAQPRPGRGRAGGGAPAGRPGPARRPRPDDRLARAWSWRALRELVGSDPAAADDRLDRLERLAARRARRRTTAGARAAAASLDQLGLVEALCRRRGVARPRAGVRRRGPRAGCRRRSRWRRTGSASRRWPTWPRTRGTACVDSSWSRDRATGLRLEVIADRGRGPADRAGRGGGAGRACASAPRRWAAAAWSGPATGGGTEVVGPAARWA